ncbi:hypothetical protein FRC02_008175 [Tulasnella sp. 418]|nr:hypothetical protein FRC02_008175 [Tulasnella sp. 418]
MRRNTVKKSRAGSSSQSKKNTSVVNRMKTKANHPSKSQLVKTTSKAASTVLRRSQRSSQSGRQDDQMDEDEDEAEVEAVVSSEKGGGIKEGALGIDDYPPTEKEWKAMKTYTTLLIPGRNDVEHHFNLHDIVLVIPENMRFRDPKKKTPVLDFWVARIVDIRSPRNHPELLWCKVHWFYNKDHFAAHLKQSRQQIPFNPKRCGKYELIDTDHESYISVPCIEDHADVTYYYENRLNQPNVSCFYVRTMYNFKTNTLKVFYLNNMMYGHSLISFVERRQLQPACQANGFANGLIILTKIYSITALHAIDGTTTSALRTLIGI